MKLDFKFVIITLIVALVIIPVSFNLFFLWDSGLARGETSDWFTLYGNIFGGLIGGFFTYLAVILTLKKEKEDKIEEKRPRIDIPNQNIKFIGSDQNDYFSPIVIELNNIGGSIAKNIECKLSLSNYEEVLSVLKQNKERLKVDFIESETNNMENLEKEVSHIHLLVRDEKGNPIGALGSVSKEYYSEFIGSCIPMILNHEAKTQYELSANVSNWINYIVRKRDYKYINFNENELFDFELEVKYSSMEYGDFTDYFKLKWKFIGITVVNSELKFEYVLKSTKVENKLA